MSELSCSVKLKPKTRWLSSGCSESPKRAPNENGARQLSVINQYHLIEWTTNYDSAHERMIQNPARGYVRDTQSSVAIPDDA